MASSCGASDEGRVVEDDPAEGRLTVRVGDLVAELTYHRHGQRLSILHTGVPGPLEGQGIGSTLVAAAVARAAAEGLVVVPRCWFARRWLQANPDAAASVTVDWS